MSKKATKADLENRIKELEELLTKADAWPKEPTLMDQIQGVERETIDEVRRLTAECHLKVGTLINQCTEKTGRTMGIASKMVAGHVPAMKDPFDEVAIVRNQDGYIEGGAKDKLRQIGNIVRKNYDFSSFSHFRLWAIQQLKAGWDGRK